MSHHNHLIYIEAHMATAELHVGCVPATNVPRAEIRSEWRMCLFPCE